jgi:hypothetical protein
VVFLDYIKGKGYSLQEAEGGDRPHKNDRPPKAKSLTA